MNTYLYTVTNLERDVNDIVISASFSITASDGVDNFTHNYYTAFRNNPVTPVPFASLTQDKVIGWIKTNVGVSSEEQADAELAAYKARKATLTGTPW